MRVLAQVRQAIVTHNCPCGELIRSGDRFMYRAVPPDRDRPGSRWTHVDECHICAARSGQLIDQPVRHELPTLAGQEAVVAILREHPRISQRIQFSEGCWEWTASRHPKGYGQVRWRGRSTKAHRVTWEMVNGPIVGGLFVCHHCDNPPCVRPDHLFLGDNGDNMRDAVAKKRLTHPSGEGASGAKLTLGQAQEVVRLASTGMTYRAIADMFAMTSQGVRGIVIGQSWPDLERPPMPTKSVPNCGTAPGYQRHLRRKESPCDPCRTANTVASAAYRRLNPRRREQVV